MYNRLWALGPLYLLVLHTYLYYIVNLLYKITLVYFITCEIQYYSLCISNMVLEPLL